MLNFDYDLNDFGFADMHRMIADGTRAREYAWKHFDELNSIPTAYTLYGPPNPYVGVLAAGGLTPARERKVQLKTRRERYIVYELDKNFNLLRIKHMRDFDKIDNTIYFFRDDVLYGQPFLGDKKVLYPGCTVTAKMVEGKPAYVALTQPNYLCVAFYKYPEPDRVETFCYLYLPGSKYCSTGLKASWEAPLGAQNSPVTLDYREEEYKHIDFASYFK